MRLIEFNFMLLLKKIKIYIKDSDLFKFAAHKISNIKKVE